MKTNLRSLLTLTLLFVGSVIYSQTALYTAGRSTSNLFAYDTTGGPGSFTLTGTIPMSTDDAGGITSTYGLSLHPSTGDMYILYQGTGGSSARRLGIVDVSTGAITDIGNIGNVTDIVFFGNQLFASGGGNTTYDFRRVDLTDASTTSLFVHTTAGYGHSLWWNSYSDKLYKTTQQGGQYSEIDTVTMTETILSTGSHPGWSSSSAAINDSVSISSNGSSGTSSLYEIDNNTWTFTYVGTINGGHAMSFGEYPIYIILDGPTTYCENENTTTLAASESGTYQWFLDGTPISGATDSIHIPVASGMYTLDLSGTLTNPINITVNPAPTASFTATPNPLDLGATPSGDVAFTNTSAEGNMYWWDFSTGITSTTENPTYSFNATGSYDVTLIVTIDSTGCSDTAVVTIDVINSTGIDELSADFSIYPVPTQDIVYVNMSGAEGNYQVELRDIQGKLIGTKTVSADSKSLNFDLTDYEAGTYLINIFNDQEEGSFKVIKK